MLRRIIINFNSKSNFEVTDGGYENKYTRINQTGATFWRENRHIPLKIQAFIRNICLLSSRRSVWS